MIQIKQYMKVAKLIAGNIMKSGNDADKNALEQWLNESEENKAIYQNINKDGWYHENKKEIEQFNVEKGWLNIQSRITSSPRTVKLIPNFYKYAAAILVIALASTYFLRDTIFNNPIENTTPIIVNNKIEKGTDKATLTLEDGSQVTLEKGTNYQTQNANSNGEEIVYDAGKPNKEAIAYNTLTIPRGGQFFIKLADGTKVWLNSESKIKYPVNFTNGETRQVELVYGEAYFEVSPSTEHKGSHFKVINNNQEVKVLGTQFNIKAYKDETNVFTTLVEGKVSVMVGPTTNVTQSAVQGQQPITKILSPNEQSNLNVATNSIEIKTVDIKSEVSWKEGVYIFRNKSLKEIMKTLARWYDMEVVFEDKKMEDIQFIGALNKNQNIVDILNDIKNFGVITNYEINNKKIILK